MNAPGLMVFGTHSDAGKSTLVAALCRAFARDGVNVAPFKAQNMARNAYVCADGGEIGVAQAVQAQAAGLIPTVDHNPILLKPEPDMRSQLIVLGRSQGSFAFGDLAQRRAQVHAAVSGALQRLRAQHELIVLEGAGSPAEINLHAHDVPNLFATRCADAAVVLVADIDRGGAFASILGTLELLPNDIRPRVRGIIINKFRGDVGLLEPGLRFIAERCGVPVLGVVPHLGETGLADEDSLAQARYRGRRRAGLDELELAVVDTPCLANFEDLLPLAREAGVLLRLTAAPRELLEADLVVLAGSKSTVHDLAFLRSSGLDRALSLRAGRGAPLLGICGGAQLLGQRIEDPDRIESVEPSVPALGILPHWTRYAAPKRTERCRGSLIAYGGAAEVDGFLLHHGRLEGPCETPAVRLADGSPEGSVSGAVVASMLHRLFDAPAARAAVLGFLRARRGLPLPLTAAGASADPIDLLAERVRAALDFTQLRAIALGRT
jgi:adenosylcobyric acid synthase